MIPLILAGAGLMGAATSYRMGSIAGEMGKQEAKTAAKGLELELTQREADRKEMLAKQLATVIASSGASGISAFEGSPLSVLRSTVRESDISAERDRFNTDLQKMTMRARARMAKQTGRVAGLAGLMSAGVQSGAQAMSLPSAPNMGKNFTGYGEN